MERNDHFDDVFRPKGETPRSDKSSRDASRRRFNIAVGRIVEFVFRCRDDAIEGYLRTFLRSSQMQDLVRAMGWRPSLANSDKVLQRAEAGLIWGVLRKMDCNPVAFGDILDPLEDASVGADGFGEIESESVDRIAGIAKQHAVEAMRRTLTDYCHSFQMQNTLKELGWEPDTPDAQKARRELDTRVVGEVLGRIGLEGEPSDYLPDIAEYESIDEERRSKLAAMIDKIADQQILDRFGLAAAEEIPPEPDAQSVHDALQELAIACESTEPSRFSRLKVAIGGGLVGALAATIVLLAIMFLPREAVNSITLMQLAEASEAAYANVTSLRVVGREMTEDGLCDYELLVKDPFCLRQNNADGSYWILTGDRRYVYDPAENVLAVFPFDVAAFLSSKGLPPDTTATAMLTAEPITAYVRGGRGQEVEVADALLDGRAAYKATVRPSGAPPLKLYFDRASSMFIRDECGDGFMEITEVNPYLDDSLFSAAPPAGATVMDKTQEQSPSE